MRVLLVRDPRRSLDPSWLSPLTERHDLVRCSPSDEVAWGEAIGETDVVIVPPSGIPTPILDRARRLRLIQKGGAGYEALDLASATAHGVPVAVTPGSNAMTVAEHTFLLMLSLGRRIDDQRDSLRRGDWRDDRQATRTVDLCEATLGIVGLGAIGAEIARRARAFGMHLLAHTRSAKPALEAELAVERVALPVLLRRSDFVVLACPLTSETRGMIDAAALAAMKPTAYLVNIARGAVVDEPALIEALGSGRIAGAGLDVFASEPPPADHPLLQLRNVVATPHVAGISAAAQRQSWRSIAENVDRVARDERPRWVVNPEVFEATPPAMHEAGVESTAGPA